MGKRQFWGGGLVALLAIGLLAIDAPANRHGHRAWLGVTTSTIDRHLVDRLDLTVDYGAIIDRIEETSPAEEAGLRRDDIIIAFNGAKVWDAHDLQDMVRDSDVGDEVDLTFVRDGDEQMTTVRLERQPRSERNQLFPEFDLDLSGIGKIDLQMDELRRREMEYDRNAQIIIDELGNRAHVGWMRSASAYLGVRFVSLTRQLGEYFGVERGAGVLVTEVERGSPADEAGIKAGDVITGIDEERIRDGEIFVEVMREYREDDEITLTIIRDKQELTLEATLEEVRSRSRVRSFGAIAPSAPALVEVPSPPAVPAAPEVHRLIERVSPPSD